MNDETEHYAVELTPDGVYHVVETHTAKVWCICLERGKALYTAKLLNDRVSANKRNLERAMGIVMLKLQGSNA